MVDQETLLDLTEPYLKSLIAEISNVSDANFDSYAPFGELGVDSFHVLKIIKTLEEDFGTLPKTLLFERFNINDLSHYFVNDHYPALSAKFSTELRESGYLSTSGDRPIRTDTARDPAVLPPEAVAAVSRADSIPKKTPILILEGDAAADSELRSLLQNLFERHKNESSVSRGTRSIAPHLFIGSEKRGYFNYSKSKSTVLAYAYTGPQDYFPRLADEMYVYCRENDLQLNLLADKQMECVGGTPFSATPFGVVQRILNIQSFSLQGGKMRRLRYLVTKFEKTGRCRIEEYVCGTSKTTDRRIAEIIDRWCETRAMVNPLVRIARDEIVAGTFSPEHRVFLTYTGDVLQNLIVLSAMSSEQNGYLMDLEFYSSDMPLGGLEYAIVNIIKVLTAEGCNTLSLGATFGPKLAPSPNADPEVDRILDELRRQNIFNDEGNLQFKNKFRPDNSPIFLCRPVGSGNADNVTDIIMMIADPSRLQGANEKQQSLSRGLHEPTCRASGEEAGWGRGRFGNDIVEDERTPGEGEIVIEGEPRSLVLSRFGNNPLGIPSHEVEFDLKTDSWAELSLPVIQARMQSLHAQLQQPADLDESLRQIFPFKYFAPTDSGRTAEHFFYKAWPKKGIVPQNLLFPTSIFHQIDNGFTPRELPHPSVFQLESEHLYKSNLNWEALREEIGRDTDGIAFVCIEVANNAAGGQPVSMQHLNRVRELLSEHSIPLVMDGTRIIENAQYLVEHEKECRGKGTWEVVREIFSCADVVIASLTKDFGVSTGGVIATNDRALVNDIEDLVRTEGSGIDVIGRKLLALALRNRKPVETEVLRRREWVQLIGSALVERDIPVVRPVAGHCILIDVKRIPEFDRFEHPVASFVAWMYLNTGIRAGEHCVGMQKKTSLNGLVRLAIPVGLKREQIEEVISRLTRLFGRKENIPELVIDGDASNAPGQVQRFKVKQYHSTSGKAAPSNSASKPGIEESAQPEGRFSPNGSRDGEGQSRAGPTKLEVRSRKQRRNEGIAIVGMAGRYPKAKNLNEMWENLVQGKDCIEIIPESRFDRRRRNRFMSKYRGGFIDDIDRFDSLFFNISPREAEMLDPQERLFLEVAWELLEDAGYYPELLVQDGSDGCRDIGVFVGAVWSMYQMLGVEEKLAGNNVSPNSFLWSIANRVSYCMNLSGPSLTLDTACSSSLTAIYLACEAIYNGECSGAIVGGVNMDLHQSRQDINVAGGAISKDGLCRSFGKGANGYVGGEGVGAVFLKLLEDAVRDRDNIHGIIRSIDVNHGGRTNGYTVPSPKAQADLILSALRKADVDARSIGYIEAHGTGTELGDPIEIVGLTNAFQAYDVEKQACAIGSIKSNIGHLEAAAGVVGVCKVLLQMKYRQLVPSLHSSELSEFIDFANSPFYVQQKLEEWKTKEIDGKVFPLRAGVSSFGAGGSNAHIILEEYVPEAEPVEAGSPDCRERVFTLSAESESQLRDAANRLRVFVRQESLGFQQNLDDIAYTLRIGRKAFTYRLAVIARTKDELIEKLTSFLDGRNDNDVLVGHVKNADAVTSLLDGQERAAFTRLLSQRRKPRKLARLWTNGLLLDWGAFRAEEIGRKVSLPTYPFADRRHWASSASERAGLLVGRRDGIHPLIDSNESTFERQLFRKALSDGEFFINDHLVSDVPTLPGVAYLELARKAGEIAAGRKVQKIRNILWISPVTVGGQAATEILIDLKPKGNKVEFEVFSESEGGERNIHSQGKLFYATKEEEEAEPEFMDLAGLREKCSKVLDGGEAYRLFRSLGLNLGPSFQVVQEVYKHEDEILGVLQLPEVREGDFHEFVLHPSLVDGSLQAAVGGKLEDRPSEMFVPYTIGEVEILHPLKAHCFSYAREVKDQNKKNSRVSKFDIFILDEDGKILVKIKDSIGVPLTELQKPSARATDTKDFAKLYYSNVWKKAPLGRSTEESDISESLLLFDADVKLRNLYRNRLEEAGKPVDDLILVQPGAQYGESAEQTYTINPGNQDDYKKLLNSLRENGSRFEKICFAWPVTNVVDEGQLQKEALERGFYSFLFLCQALINAEQGGTSQLLYLYSGEGNQLQPHNEAVNGFARTLGLEHPRLSCKTLEVCQENESSVEIMDALVAEFRSDAQDAMTVRYEDRERYVRSVERFDLDEIEGSSPAEGVGLKEKGAYLITGGAGGLGLIFARFLAKEYRARLLLTGRSALSVEREAELEELRRAGAEVVYFPADVSRREAVEDLVKEGKSRFGRINGIIHSAGVLRDSYIRNKTREEVDAVLAPKVHGTIHLDEVTKDENLDFFVTFSSLAAIGGNAGQGDYSFANHFMDSFAARRENLKERGERSGKTLSLNWSLWADGGMKIDEQTEKFFRRSLGLEPLSTETGLEAFAKGLSVSRVQFAVIEGVQDKIEKAWGLRKREPKGPASPSGTYSETVEPARSANQEQAGNLITLVQRELSEIVMEFLKLSADDISLDKILLDLGFDSLGLTTFANSINQKYELDVTPVLFFEYPTIGEIAEHLAVEHKDEMLRVHQASTATASFSSKPAAAPAGTATGRVNEVTIGKKEWHPDAIDKVSQDPSSREDFLPGLRFANNPIAIVGMSGVMPQSRDLDEFWENLIGARNLITVIPEDRWIWEDFYGDPLKEEDVSNSKWGGFMKEVDKFDPLFFGISPREAALMDPQQRIFLETVWAAIEDSGHKVSDLSGTKTGIFVGTATNDYTDLLTRQGIGIDAFTSTGNSHSVLVNRISYLLNLHGPSAPLDTACSSSLVAIHRALESIHTGSSDMAIVGGVQVMTSPAAYIAFGQAGMLSPDGKCKTFDKDANGYVRGEGVGAIFLKPLSMAQADGDHIYALIKSTAENHGGRANSLTAPNPNAQSELLTEAYEKAGIDPATVGYIECHGTGTSLGDPVEIQALKNTFSSLYKQHNRPTTVETPHCGLGSVKTNIGHLETAAGIAGILKVLLALKHKQIPATIHFEEINPYINLKGSPFYIADRSRPWDAIINEDGTVLPRRAGVSSFGFGGANAHVVLEEYLPPERHAAAEAPAPQLIVLSAKNDDRLRAYVGSLRAYLEKENPDLAGLAHTLQVGRDEMPARLALVVSSAEELKRKLTEILEHRADVENVYRNELQRKKAKAPSIATENPDESFVQTLIEQKDLLKLAEVWTLGVAIDWSLLYTAGSPERLSLPTYPFAADRYWIPVPQRKVASKTKQVHQSLMGTEILHPLIHRNVSTLKEQKFVSRFTGEEFFFADHIVETQKVLPGVAYMEMARFAGEVSGETEVKCIRNAVWVRPLVITDDAKDVEVSLTPNQNEVEFSVKSIGREHRVTHCKGKLAYAGTSSGHDVLDIAGIRERCSEEVLTGTELYQFLSRSGLKLRKSFQIVQGIYANPNESLAIVRLPEHLEKEAKRFLLHPALMDGSLHSAIGLMKKSGLDIPLSLPFSVGEIQLFQPLTDLYYAYATWAADTPRDDRNLLKVDFHLLDREGRILVRMREFLSKPLYQSTKAPVPAKEKHRSGKSLTRKMYYRKVWKEPSPLSGMEQPRAFGPFLVFSQSEAVRERLAEQLKSTSSGSPRIVLVKPGAAYQEAAHDAYVIDPEQQEDYQRLVQSVSRQGAVPENVVHLWSERDFVSEKDDLSSSMKKGVFSLLYLSQALIQALQESSGTTNSGAPLIPRRIALLHLYPGHEQDIQPHHAAISGFAKCLALENSRFTFRNIEFRCEDRSATPSPVEIAECVLAELQENATSSVEVCYRAGRRLVKQVEEIQVPGAGESMIKERGAYLITGGAGGLGLIFARYLARHAGARIALAGRSSLRAEQEEAIQALQSFGSDVIYYEADVSSYGEVEQLVKEVKSRFGTIDGVLHAAGVTRDSLISNKTAEEMEAVFSAKVHGTVNLDRATREGALDFFAVFSSLTAVTGNPGQGDYAYANSFMDEFVVWRNKLEEEGKRSGKAISFNWPLWKRGGMQIDRQTEMVLEQSMGIQVLDTETGLGVFEIGLASGHDQILAMEGNPDKVRKRLGISGEDQGDAKAEDSRAGRQAAQEPTASGSRAAKEAAAEKYASDQRLRTLLEDDLLQLVTRALDIKKEAFSFDTDMSEYGFESISLTKFFSEVNARYSLDLTPAIFFEYPTFTSLSQYLYEDYEEELTEYFGAQLTESPPTFEASSLPETAVKDASVLETRFSDNFTAPDDTDSAASQRIRSTDSPIAVVGMSGVMPQSEDLDAFWENLAGEKDLITRIPPDRWDWKAYQGNPFEERNKTNSGWGGFMKEVDKFDTFFFGISPREAELMDPQQRLFLETVWKTIEDSGHKPSELAGTRTGLFVGVAGFDYLEIMRENKVDVVAHYATGMSHCVLANRISHFLDLRGPSEPIDTACSSSLVAIHRAVEAISCGSCDMAIAGGVNVLLTPGLYLAFGNAGMLADDGRCKTFDKRANGYVRGEGSAAIFLKRLDRAVADRDHVYAVVKGAGVNHGGHATSLTAPNPNAQADLLIDVYEKARIDPDTLGYIEAHGTGTALGDPVEINGLKKAFKELHKRKGKPPTKHAYCGIGSVKTNIGHLETAAGIAGVIKVLLGMKHKRIPASIHFAELNPHIRLEESPFYVVQRTQEWNALQDEGGNDLPRRAGISSFGFGGANAHIVLEEYPASVESGEVPTYANQTADCIIPLSARTPEQLKQMASDLLAFIRRERASITSPGGNDLVAMAYTLQIGREAMAERMGMIVSSVDQLVNKLHEYVNGSSADVYEGRVRRGEEALSIVAQDDDVKQIIVSKWTAQRNWPRLLQLWVNGLDLDWNSLYGEEKPRRISLPTYPFARERYWIDTRESEKTGGGPPEKPMLHDFQMLLNSISEPGSHSRQTRETAKNTNAFQELLETIY